MTTQQRLEQLLDAVVVDENGARVGEVVQILLDNTSGLPTWVRVAAGALRPRLILVPLTGASLETGALRVPHPRARLRAAPRSASRALGRRSAPASRFMCILPFSHTLLLPPHDALGVEGRPRRRRSRRVASLSEHRVPRSVASLSARRVPRRVARMGPRWYLHTTNKGPYGF